MAGVVYRRGAEVVWRVAPDRVLLRSAARTGQELSADLTGAAALVWAALDEPATQEQLADRLREADLEHEIDRIAGAVDQLMAAGWVTAG